MSLYHSEAMEVTENVPQKAEIQQLLLSSSLLHQVLKVDKKFLWTASSEEKLKRTHMMAFVHVEQVK